MDPKLKDILDRTNLGDLLKPVTLEIDLNQPVETAPPQKIAPARSTVDPFQINFATADIAGKLRDSNTSKGIKIFAFSFLGGPMIIFGLGLVFMAWSSPNSNPLGTLFASAVGLIMAGFWPYVIFSNHRKQSQRS